MNLKVTRWGNSFALRIPAELVRRMGLREGSTLEAQVGIDGSLSVRPAQWSRKAFALELAQARDAQPMNDSVMHELRGTSRY